MEEVIGTDIIKMPVKRFLFVIYIEKGRIWLIISLLGILTFLGLGIFLNLKFLMLMFMWICIIIPLSAVFLFFYFGLLPLTSLNSVNHKIEFFDSELKIYTEENKKDAHSHNYTFHDSKSDNENQNEEPVFKERMNISYFLCSKIKIYPEALILFFKSPNEGFIWLPPEAFKEKGRLASVKKRIEICMQQT